MRNFGTDARGRYFDDATKLNVWRRGREVVGYPVPNDVVRLDACGNRMHWNEYGNVNSPYGWEIDHIVPVAANGGDELSNLQPLQWRNNRVKSDGPLVCAVAAR